MILLDVVWPSMVLQGHLLDWVSIGFGLVLEWPFAKLILGRTWIRSIGPTFAMNAASSLVGIVAAPALGALWEIGPGSLVEKQLGLSTFNPVSWVVAVILVIAVNVLVEGLVLIWGFQGKVSLRNGGLLLAANSLSVGVALGLHR